jgi:hypothetical protein
MKFVNFWQFWLYLCIPLGMSAESKVLIFTYSYNRPDFVRIQHDTFKKFLKDPYEFIVFNDASTSDMNHEIHRTCHQLGIRCVDIPQQIHLQPYLPRWPGESLNHPAVRNSNVVQYSLDTLGFQHDGIVAIFDSDLFLVRDFSIKHFMETYAIAGLPQSKENNGKHIEYLWIGLAFMDMRKLPNKETLSFNCGIIDGVPVDAGGFSHCYLRDHPETRVRHILSGIRSPFEWCDVCRSAKITPCLHNTQALITSGCDEDQIEFIHSGPANCEFMEESIFFHYRGGTNWDHQSRKFHDDKTAILNKYIHNILTD